MAAYHQVYDSLETGICSRPKTHYLIITVRCCLVLPSTSLIPGVGCTMKTILLQIHQIWIELITSCEEYCERRCTKHASLIWTCRQRHERMASTLATWSTLPTPFSVAVSIGPDQLWVFWSTSLAIFPTLSNQLDSWSRLEWISVTCSSLSWFIPSSLWYFSTTLFFYLSP